MCSFFLPESTFLKRFLEHEIFKRTKEPKTHTFFRRGKSLWNTSKFPGKLSQNSRRTHTNTIRTDWIFQKSFLPGNLLRTHMIFRAIIPQEQIFCKIAWSDAFVYFSSFKASIDALLTIVFCVLSFHLLRNLQLQHFHQFILTI